MIIEIDGISYNLATSLRVAYKVQGMHNHMPYSKVFEGLAEMPLEEQIGILYAAFSVANPEAVSTITKDKFLDYYLDHMDLGQLMRQLEELVKAIMGDMPTGQDSAEAENPGN